MAQGVGEPLRHARVVSSLPQRDDDQLAAGLVLHADVDELGVLLVADEQRAPLPGLDPAGVDGRAHARRDLQLGVQRAEHTLEVALGRVVGDRYEGHSKRSSPKTGDSRSSATRRMASRTPGMKLVRSVVTWRMVRVWATSPRITSWSATRPGRRTEWIAGSPSIRRAVRAAVPEGVSTLAGWWYSMISALAMCLDASAAKRIISTAPIAKLGAANTLPGAPATARLSSSSDQPV